MILGLEREKRYRSEKERCRDGDLLLLYLHV